MLANNCTDDTVAVARRVARAYPNMQLHVIDRALPPHLSHVGYARRLLMDEAHRRLMLVGRPRGIIAMTDGDTRPAPTWIAAMLHEAAGGADGIGGNILTDPREVAAMDAGERSLHMEDVRYKRLLARATARLAPDPRDPWPRHYHHTGASLALTAALYERVGGIPPLPSSEDVALYNAMLRAGARFRHSPAVKVTTSTRQVGRARHGMADTLLAWSAMAHANQTLLVEPLDTVAARMCMEQQLRQHWRAGRHGDGVLAARIDELADAMNVDRLWLTEALFTAHSFGALLQQFDGGQLPHHAPLVEIGAAIHDVEQWLARAYCI